ncbi:MAG: adenylosuccinate synthase [Nitrospinota bacterium]
MGAIAVVGMQWGDEGKGKVVDLLARDAQVVVRYQGGHNAGHTVVLGEEEFILHLVPTGILHPGCRCIIGSGVVVDPFALAEEMRALERRGVAVAGRLLVSLRAHLIMPYHRLLDRHSEDLLGSRRIGTTGRGIGPCYADKVARLGIRLADLFEGDEFPNRVRASLAFKRPLFEGLSLSKEERAALDADRAVRELEALRPFLEPLAADTEALLREALERGERVILEGAQGILLDVDHGTYPFVTSSNAGVGGAFSGLGIWPRCIDAVVGVMKAYTTRVGEGPFPTELPGAEGEELRSRGGEFGATTGRPRRCGWFDAVAACYAREAMGVDWLAVTKLDVLDPCATIRVCVAYRAGGRKLTRFPTSACELARYEPVYEEFPGWGASTVGATSFSDLPPPARAYLARIEGLVGCPIGLISTGPQRDRAILLRDRLFAAGRERR